MAEDRQAGYWNTRPKARTFTHLVSPVGENMEETPVSSPSTPVTGARGHTHTGRASTSGSAKDQRRGG